MPYSKISESRIKELDGVPLTLSQINHIAEVADSIGSDSGKNGWAIAISQFKKSHHTSGNSWVADEKGETEKEISDVFVEKEEDGSWRITTVSSAAVADREGEIFETDSMDYEIQLAKETKEYPEYRLFHKKYLPIGKVEKMYRVGIFIVDEGHSYTDDFSTEVCEKMLANNDGKWKVSRGFYLFEASGGCPNCGEQLVVTKEHMLAGFRCPVCRQVHLNYRGTLKDLRFKKTKTFDVTITDIPAVPYTGVRASKNSIPEVTMSKEEIRKKLLAAGISKEEVEAKLGNVSDEMLKELDEIPDAKLLKEVEKLSKKVSKSVSKEDEDLEASEGDQTFVLDESVLKAFTGIVRKEVREEVENALDGLTIDTGEDELEIQMKEFPEFVELSQKLNEVHSMLSTLLSGDEQRLKELLQDVPRNGKLRILRFKSTDMEDEEEDEDEEEEPKKLPTKKVKKEMVEEGVIRGADGEIAESMTEFITKK